MSSKAVFKGVGDDIQEAWKETFKKLGVEFGHEVPKEYLDLVLSVTTVPPRLVKKLLVEMEGFSDFTVVTNFEDGAKRLKTTISLLGDVTNDFPKGEIPAQVLEAHKAGIEKACVARDSLFEIIMAAARLSKLVPA